MKTRGTRRCFFFFSSRAVRCCFFVHSFSPIFYFIPAICLCPIESFDSMKFSHENYMAQRIDRGSCVLLGLNCMCKWRTLRKMMTNGKWREGSQKNSLKEKFGVFFSLFSPKATITLTTAVAAVAAHIKWIVFLWQLFYGECSFSLCFIHLFVYFISFHFISFQAELVVFCFLCYLLSSRYICCCCSTVVSALLCSLFVHVKDNAMDCTAQHSTTHNGFCVFRMSFIHFRCAYSISKILAENNTTLMCRINVVAFVGASFLEFLDRT